ncbi:MAG: DUF4139 domain-containing protein [Sphingobacteriales bacterium]|nr:DUF4139 domain-containing protein [Sphingobacteriales bacterium]
MKNQIKILWIALLWVQSLSASKPIFASLDRVMVYLSGAHLYYSEQVNVQAGNNVFIFENISGSIQENTLQANAKGGTLMEVNTQIRYKEKKSIAPIYAKAIAQVIDSLEENEYHLLQVANQLSALEQEKKMLLNHPLINGKSQRDSLPLLKSSMEFTREKLSEILNLELKWKRRKDSFEKEKNRLNLRHEELSLLQNGNLNDTRLAAEPIHQILITVYAEQAGLALINFNYFIANANWVPSYDLLANASNKQIAIKYFAKISQTSGLNWRNANLSLSSSNPMELNIKPNLANWYIGFYEYQQMKQKALSNAARPLQKQTVRTTDNLQESDMEAERYVAQKSLSEYIQISENLIRTEYAIKLKYDIDCDGKFHKVMIKEQQIPIELVFAAVPKLSSESYLMGKISGWEDLQILPGAGRIYFDGAFVGETYLGDQSNTDTLQLNLGRDKSMVVNRKKIKDKTKIKTLENEKIETRTIEILVRNTKSQSILIDIEDQIPVSQNPNEIKVTLIDANGANLDETSGLLTWNLKIASKETKKISFTYEVRYPKNKVVVGL